MMKLKYLFLISVLAFAGVGCAKGIGESGYKDPYADGTKIRLSSRYLVTTDEEGISGYMPVSWSDDASVSVNGYQMFKTRQSFADTTVAEYGSTEQIEAPYYVTSPYYSRSNPKVQRVMIPSTQTIGLEGWDFSTLPLCGYSESDSLTLRHLTGGICLSLVNSSKASIITKVNLSVSEDDKIAGEFEVDCINAVMTPSNSASSSIDYVYTEGLAVVRDNGAAVYMFLPAGDYEECVITIYDAANKSMTVTLPAVSVKAGAVRMYGDVEYEAGGELVVGGQVSRMVEGYVKDTSGRPVEGVAVSDGFTVVRTNAEGYYMFEEVSTDTWHIYYTTPSDYEIAINQHGQPCFWQDYIPGTSRYDFTLTPLAGGKEEKFALFTYGDPQVYSNNNLNRFLKEAVPGIKAHASTFTIPIYGMGLGDIVFNTDNYKTTYQMVPMRNGFSVSSVGMPVFQVLGNHDYTEYDANNPLVTDERNSDINIKAQREYNDVFGPADYSFDRSDAHVIGMRNVIFSSPTTSGTGHYHGGFTDRQFEWLKQDLSQVPKDKLIILSVHIPIYNCTDKTISSLNTGTNITNVLNLLGQYDNVRIMSGHVHTQRTYIHSNGIVEHNSASVAGAWWNLCVSGDGCPNGFNVYTIQGNKVVDGYYYGYTASSSSRNHQMRLYRGNAITGGAIEGDNKNGTKGYYAFNFDDDVILANVYNADPDWTISVYEDGAYSGDMTLVSPSQPSISSLVGDYTYENPRRPADGVETGHDMWMTGYFMGVLGKTTSNGGWQECHHMYKYKLKNKNSEIKVVAKDRYGNTYQETKITEGTDHSAAVKP